MNFLIKWQKTVLGLTNGSSVICLRALFLQGHMVHVQALVGYRTQVPSSLAPPLPVFHLRPPRSRSCRQGWGSSLGRPHPLAGSLGLSSPLGGPLSQAGIVLLWVPKTCHRILNEVNFSSEWSPGNIIHSLQLPGPKSFMNTLLTFLDNSRKGRNWEI